MTPFSPAVLRHQRKNGEALPPFAYLSFGAGVQSTALLAMSGMGLKGCPKADVAIFADTKQEPAWVYEHLEVVKSLSSIPIVTVSAGDLGRDSLGGKWMRLPAFTAGSVETANLKTEPCDCLNLDGLPDESCLLCGGTGVHEYTAGLGGGMVRRQCTREYKIAPIQKWVREHLGYQPRQRVKHRVTCLVGISVDEIGRAKPSTDKWVTRLHPLIDADMRRADCLKLLTEVGWPIPKKSACVFCPYHDDATWRDMRENYPVEWQRAVEFDDRVRNSSRAGISNPVYLHRSLKPLDQVEFRPAHTTPLFDSFTEECEGYCGV